MPQTHILLMNEDGKYYEDKRTYCGYGPYFCCGFPIKKIYDTKPRKPVNG